MAVAGPVGAVSRTPGAVHRALVVTAAAGLGTANGATLRAHDVRRVLTSAGYDVTVVGPGDVPTAGDPYCLGVAVSFVQSSAVRRLGALSYRVWLDAVDSWRLLDGSGLRAGSLSYGARAVRDGCRLLVMPPPDLVTWISAADRAADGRSVRGSTRLVLPGSGPGDRPVAPGPRRAVLAGDWTYGPNRAGLRWFVRHVLPRMDVPVEVFGRAVPEGLPRQLVRHGYVADGQALHRTGDVHLAPVRYGAGVKRKVLQPLLLGLPVVTTPVGAHGLRAHPLLDVASTPDAFAQAVLRRLDAPVADAVSTRLADVVDLDETPQVLDWLAACPAHR